MKDKLEFHKGIDYAVIMRPGQTTDNPLASLYGQDRDVTKFGKLFAAAPQLRDALQLIIQDGRCEKSSVGIGACFRPLSGLEPDAKYLANRCCFPCIAHRALKCIEEPNG